MVQYRDLNAPPSRMFADVVADTKAQVRQSKTGDAGVKDLGESGDVVWTRPDAPEFTVSIRDIDGDLQDAQGRIDEAKADSAEALVRVGEAETAVEAVQGGLDTLETVTLPGAVAELEAADSAVQQAVAGLEGEVSAVQGVANAAQDAATQATSDAAAAAQDAADAAGLAASKGDVLIQSAAPAAEMRKASTLWIDTTGGANAPKRWDGAAWIAVTDRATVDAANLAAQAKAAADDAQTAADDAQTTATNAATAAGAAQSTATEALTSANGKSKITRSTSNPPAQYSGRVDDLWWVLSSLGSGGRVLSQWRWNSNVWVSEQVGGEVIANLDAAKISTGYLGANRIEAGSITGKKLLIGMGGDRVANGTFADGMKGWSVTTPGSLVEGAGESGSNAIVIPKDASSLNYVGINSDQWPVPGPGKVLISVRVKADKAVTSAGQVNIYLRSIAKGGALTYSMHEMPPIPANTWVTVSALLDVAAVAVECNAQVSMRPSFPAGNTLYVSSVSARDAIGSTLIEDGAITTGKLLAGAVTAPKITFTEELSGEVANFMSTESKKLVVSEEAILNHATLIGQTVVDDINVQGKLIGTDGVFTGTVDFENINVTGEILGDMISGEHIYGTIVEGGEIITTDAGAGQVTLSDTAYTSSSEGTSGPGIRIDPQDSSRVTFPPGIGPHGEGVRVDGGRSNTGRAAWVHADSLGVTTESRGMTTDDPRSYMTTQPDGVRLGIGVGTYGEPTYRHNYMVVNQNDVQLSSRRGLITAGQVGAKVSYTGGFGTSSGFVEATPIGTTLSYTESGVTRALLVDSSGVWVKTMRSGAWEMWNLEETASDSGWISLPLNSAVTGAGSPAYRIKGGVVFFRGTLTLPGSNWASGWTTLAAVTNSAHRPSFDIQRAGASRATGGIVLQLDQAGSLQMYLPSSLPGTTTVQLSPMFYPIG